MRVKIPKKWDSEILREVMSEFLFTCKEENHLVFEGDFGFGVTNSQLLIGARNFRKFVVELEVEGGTKSLNGNWLFVRPYQDKDVHFRFPKKHYELLKIYAKEMKTTPSTAIHNAIGEKLFWWVKTKKESEKEEQAVGYA